MPGVTRHKCLKDRAYSSICMEQGAALSIWRPVHAWASVISLTMHVCPGCQMTATPACLDVILLQWQYIWILRANKVCQMQK